MPTLTPGAGTTFSVCPDAPASVNASNYAALSWTLVEGLESFPEIGGARNVITFNELSSGTILKSRGSEDAGEPTVNIADDPTDAGQVLLKAAYDASSGTAAEIVSIRLVDPASKITYARTKVASWRKLIGGSDEIIQRQAQMLIESGTIVEA